MAEGTTGATDGAAERWPLDFDALKKGDIIPKEKLEGIFGHHWREAQYSFDCMALAKEINDHLTARGLDVVIVQRNYDLVLLDDEMASRIVARNFNRRLRGAKRDHFKFLRIDTGAFDDELKKQYNRNATTQGAILLAVQAVQRKQIAAPKPEPVRRALPPLADSNAKPPEAKAPEEPGAQDEKKPFGKYRKIDPSFRPQRDPPQDPAGAAPPAG